MEGLYIVRRLERGLTPGQEMVHDIIQDMYGNDHGFTCDHIPVTRTRGSSSFVVDYHSQSFPIVSNRINNTVDVSE